MLNDAQRVVTLVEAHAVEDNLRPRTVDTIRKLVTRVRLSPLDRATVFETLKFYMADIRKAVLRTHRWIDSYTLYISDPLMSCRPYNDPAPGLRVYAVTNSWRVKYRAEPAYCANHPYLMFDTGLLWTVATAITSDPGFDITVDKLWKLSDSDMEHAVLALRSLGERLL